jgi:hypothetical protein
MAVKSAKGKTNFNFWSTPTTEPKRQFKFLVTIPGFQPFLVSKCDRPTVNVSETPHKFLNHSFYYPGTVEWQPVNITFVDPGRGSNPQNDATLLLYNKILEMGYRTPDRGFTDELRTNTVSKGLSSFAFSEIKIQTLQQRAFTEEINNQTTNGETFILKNAWPTTVNFGSFDYSGDELLQLETTFRYDYCQIQTAGGGILR